MGFREERIAKNEAVVRRINEVIQQAHESAPRSSFMHIVCECGYEKCDSIIGLTKDEYERVRSDPRQFCVLEEDVMRTSRQSLRKTTDSPLWPSGRERLRR